MIWPLLGKPTVLVHLVDVAESIEGVLLHKGARELRLVGARVWEGADASRALEGDGAVVIPRERVAFWQVLR